MDNYEGEQAENQHVHHMYQWNTGGVTEHAFSSVAAPLIETGSERATIPTSTIVDANEDLQLLTLTVPARWFDHAAERFCDLAHTKQLYLTRARNYTNTKSTGGSTNGDIATRVYIFQFFFQLVGILWRWKDSNDDLPWASGIPAANANSDSSSEDDGDDADKESAAELPNKRKRKRKKKGKKKRKVESNQNTSIGGAVRSECSLLIDWRWRAMCTACRTLRATNPWTILFCDHVDNPRDMMPVLDYTFWFIVRGWGVGRWKLRVGYAAIAAIKRLHIKKPDARDEWLDPGEESVEDSQGAPSEGSRWNTRERDGSDMWKNIQCANHFAKSAQIYLQDMGYSRIQINALMNPPDNPSARSPSIRNLVGIWNPFKVYSVSTTFRHLQKNDKHLLRQVLLEASTMELQYNDISNWPQFWRRFLPHYDFMCVRGFEDVFPAVYHRDEESFVHAQTAADASRSIKFVSAYQSETRALPPICSNSEMTKVWRMAAENETAIRDGQHRLLYGFMQQYNTLFTEDEQMIVQNVWNYVRRKRAFIKYMLQCRSAESHLSHALVCLWDEFATNNGAVYHPASIRPPHYGPGIPNPLDFYYHNLSPFCNFVVNRAYQMWRHHNVDPPHVMYASTLLDSANNATRGELQSVGLHPMVHSTEGGAGKSYIKDTVVGMTRVRGTTTVVSHRSGAVQNIQRLGTHDDMVLLTDEIKQKTFANKDEGGMADPKIKELMSAGETQSQVMMCNPGGRGHNDRDIKTYLYRELCTVIATGNLQIMQIKDTAFLSRWLLMPLNIAHNNAVKRPREPPNPPAHVVMQLHQIQYVITEVHKMVQVGAMEVEDTYVVNIMLNALKDELAKYGNNTQRKEMQIRSFARIHAIADLVVTHFWTPGGLFYNETITPSRLVALNDFLTVRMEHVIFALGQMDELLTFTDEHVIKLAITHMWRHSNFAFTVSWGGRVGEEERINCYDDREGRMGFMSKLTPTLYDTVEFSGRSISFMKQFSACIRHVICHELSNDPTNGTNIPTADQIAAQLEQWCMRMWNPKRATREPHANLLACSPEGIIFTTEVLAAEPMCRTTIQNGEMCIKFPVHMLLSTAPQQSLVSSPQLKPLIAFSVEYSATKVTKMHGKSKKRNDAIRTFILGRGMADRQEYFDVAHFPPEVTTNNGVTGSSTSVNIDATRPMIPYRFYEDIMDPEEFTELAGIDPPASREHLVPMLFSLDEFAVRSRIMKLGLNMGLITNQEFGSVLSKIVLANYTQNGNADDLGGIMRPTMMIWGNIYQKSSAEIYATMQAPPKNTVEEAPNNIMCDYQDHKFVKLIHNEEGLRDALSNEHFIARRTTAINNIKHPINNMYNAYKRPGDDRCAHANIYPETTPCISPNDPLGPKSLHARKRRWAPKSQTSSTPPPATNYSTPHLSSYPGSNTTGATRAAYDRANAT